ncbi:MAG: flippase-like domain-containing protein [Cyclobacteriaceae bacterium]|nr:flippase-like domain-containing protein [Cyclobacteriaceae bacterium]MDW8332155.1 lysylphosphatidylglycerol synthase transmembrane domain-containing protein [Cyclobacteriaceae bacterium]
MKRAAAIQYFIWLVLAGLLLWLSLRVLTPPEGQNRWDYLISAWRRTDKAWLWLMALLAMVSHLIRAERWRLLLGVSGQPVSFFHALLSLLVGYLINLVIPRGGEISRCLNLYKLNSYPADKSFGTVVAERAIDLMCFLLVLVIAFFVEFDKLAAFVKTLPVELPGKPAMWLWMVALALFIVVIIVLRLFVKRFPALQNKLSQLWKGFLSGLRSIRYVRQPGLFITYSILIWLLYFLMTYAVLMAFEETRSLGWQAILNLFAIGSLAMVLPMPGGTGSYHTLVPAGLSFLYGLNLPDAVAFTFVFHAWQTLIMIAGGVPALLTTLMLGTGKKIENTLPLEP